MQKKKHRENFDISNDFKAHELRMYIGHKQ